MATPHDVPNPGYLGPENEPPLEQALVSAREELFATIAAVALDADKRGYYTDPDTGLRILITAGTETKPGTAEVYSETDVIIPEVSLPPELEGFNRTQKITFNYLGTFIATDAWAAGVRTKTFLDARGDPAVDTIKEVMGQQDPATTLVYGHILDNLNETDNGVLLRRVLVEYSYADQLLGRGDPAAQLQYMHKRNEGDPVSQHPAVVQRLMEMANWANRQLLVHQSELTWTQRPLRAIG